MKTVTDDYVTAQRQAVTTVSRKVEYKRRYWDESTSAYVWEGSWTQLAEAEILKISPISWKLDTQVLNEFKVGNVTITVENFANKWRKDNPDGIFGKDAVSPIYNYEPNLMKFKISSGIKLPDNSIEYVALFSGVATDYPRESSRKTCQINVEGLETSLRTTKAEDIATSIVQENAGTGDASEDEFTTSNPGVGGVTLVSLDGVTQVQEDDYTVSQLNDTALGAMVTFVTPPGNGVVVRISYYYWAQNLPFGTIVKNLLNAAGISSGDQEVEDVVFPGNVLNAVEFTTNADFNSGVLTDLVVGEHAGLLEIDWEDAAHEESQTWSQATTGWTISTTSGASLVSNATELVYTGSGSSDVTLAYRAFDRKHGHYQFKYKFDTTPTSNDLFINLAPIPNQGTSEVNNVRVLINQNTIFTRNTSVSFASGTSYHTIDIYIKGKSVVIKVDSSTIYTADVSPEVNYVDLGFRSSVAEVTRIKEFVTPKATVTGNWVSPAIDAASTPSAWGNFNVMDQDEGYSGALVYYTDTSADDIAYEGFSQVIGGRPQSTLQRYIKIKAEINFATNNWPIVQYGDPHVDSTIIRFTTSSTNVLLSNFNGLNVYEAIQRLGEFTNYEFGFKPNDKFFFRSRKGGINAMTLTESDYIQDVRGLSTGDKELYGTVRAIYGSRIVELSDDGNNPLGPKARILNRRFEISPDSNIQIAATADIATGVAINFFAFLSRSRERMRLLTKLLPQLDLSDNVKVSLRNNTPAPMWFLGDPDVDLGDTTKHLWGEKDQIISNLTTKVVGVRYDLERYNCELQLEET